jgi:hypothetical protein
MKNIFKKNIFAAFYFINNKLQYKIASIPFVGSLFAINTFFIKQKNVIDLPKEDFNGFYKGLIIFY